VPLGFCLGMWMTSRHWLSNFLYLETILISIEPLSIPNTNFSSFYSMEMRFNCREVQLRWGHVFSGPLIHYFTSPGPSIVHISELFQLAPFSFVIQVSKRILWQLTWLDMECFGKSNLSDYMNIEASATALASIRLIWILGPLCVLKGD